MLLRLDDGGELPAHSQILARYSGVFASMLDGPLSDTSAIKNATVPLSDCSRATAISLLSVLYTGPSQPKEHIKWESSMSIASLAHKLDMKVHLLTGSLVNTRNIPPVNILWSMAYLVQIRSCSAGCGEAVRQRDLRRCGKAKV